MAHRKTIFASGEIYHLFTRGVAKQPIFTNSYDYRRITELIEYYRFSKPPLRFSHFRRLPSNTKKSFTDDTRKTTTPQVEIIAYCLMPNHLHFLVKQVKEKGISKFMANLLNSYVRYYNTKHKRVGPLFQSNFKAVRIVNNEQLVHVNRYIHLNPATSYLTRISQLEKYPWSSLQHYLGKTENSFINEELVLEQFKTKESYKKFVLDQADYQRQLDEIKHIILEK